MKKSEVFRGSFKKLHIYKLDKPEKTSEKSKLKLFDISILENFRRFFDVSWPGWKTSFSQWSVIENESKLAAVENNIAEWMQRDYTHLKNNSDENNDNLKESSLKKTNSETTFDQGRKRNYSSGPDDSESSNVETKRASNVKEKKGIGEYEWQSLSSTMESDDVADTDSDQQQSVHMNNLTDSQSYPLWHRNSKSRHKLDALVNSVEPDTVLSKQFSLSIKASDLRLLLGRSNWLNDTIINCYCFMIAERSMKRGKNLPKVYSFSCHFFSVLEQNGIESVNSWTDDVDLFSYDILLVPVCSDTHWFLMSVDFRRRLIRMYDSLGTARVSSLMVLKEYLVSEARRRRLLKDIGSWKIENVKGLPQQQNGNDCGVFLCCFAEHLTRGDVFKQTEVGDFRYKIAFELLKCELFH